MSTYVSYIHYCFIFAPFMERQPDHTHILLKGAKSKLDKQQKIYDFLAIVAINSRVYYVF
jgi:hypothetical protein